MSNLRNILSGVKKKSLSDILSPVKSLVKQEVPTLQQPIKSAITQAVGQVRSTAELQPIKKPEVTPAVQPEPIKLPEIKPTGIGLAGQLQPFRDRAEDVKAGIEAKVKTFRVAPLKGFGTLPVAPTFQDLQEAQKAGIRLRPPTPQEPEYEQYQESFAQFTAKEQPLFAGVVEEVTPFAKIDPTMKLAIERTEKEAPGAFKAGKITGKGMELLAGYLAAGPIAAKIGAKGLVGKQGVALLVDTIAQTPFEMVEFVNNDQTAQEDVKQYVKNRAVDAAFNLAFGAVSEVAKGVSELRKLKQANDPEVIKAIQEGWEKLDAAKKAKFMQEEEAYARELFGEAPDIQRELMTEISAKEFLDESKKVADIMDLRRIRDYYKTLEEGIVATNPTLPQNFKLINNRLLGIMDEYNQAVKEVQNFYGHFELTPQEVGRIKTDLGIDFDDILKRMADIEEQASKGYWKTISEEATKRSRIGAVAGAIDVPPLRKPQQGITQELFPTLPEVPVQATKQAPELFPTVAEPSPSIRETLEQVKPRAIAEDIGIPSARITPEIEKIDIPLPKGEPIDTKDLVLTELPKTAKRNIGDVVDRVRQELVSKNLPFERVGKIAGNEELIAKGGNLNRITGTVDYNLGSAQSSMEGLDIGKSVKEIVEGIPEAQRSDFFDYVLNKHNIDRFAQGKPVFGETVDTVASSQNVARLDNPVFDQKQKEITQYFENLMQEWGVKSGLVSQETADALRELYPNYVPTYRALDIDRVMGGGTGFVKKALKKAKGSEKQILPIDQQMAFLTDKMIRNARKNEVMLSLDDAFTSNPEALSRYIKSVSDVAAEPVDDIIKVGTNLDKEVQRQGENFVINYYKNGQPKQMTVNKTMYEAMRTMEQDALDKGLGVVRKYATNPFKSLITTYNPLFAVRNIMRDVPTALIYSNDPIKMVASVPQATQEMLSNGKLWKQYQALGGTRSGLFNYEKGVKFNFSSEKGLKEQITSTLQSAGEKFEAINNFTETLPRFSEYVASINKGESPAVALMRSAEVTTDFARFGKQTKRADAVVPYLNASVQGLDKFARQIAEKPLQTMAKGGVVVSVPALVLDQVNKNNDQYNQMTARERNQYYHIPKEDGTFWRIPRSREVGVLFGTLFEWINRARRGEDVDPEEIMSVATENFTPVNGFDSNILKPAGNFWKIATGKDPDAKNFFGSKIVPTSLQRYSPEMQYDEKTTSIAKNLGAYFNVSPKAIDYLMDSYLGVIGDVGMPYLTDQDVDWKAPLERAFIADPVFKSESQNEFYDTLEEMNKRAQDLNKEYDIPSKVITPLERETKILNRFNKQLSTLRKEQKAAQQAGNDDKARDLRKAMNDLSQVALDKLSTEEELKKNLDDFLKALERRKR